MATWLYLEDLHVGQRFRSPSHVMTRERIISFAQEFDPQSFHVDEEAAKSSLFGELVASGWHTAAVTIKLLVASGLKVAGGLIGSGGEIRWPMPVKPGDELHLEIEILEARESKSHPERGIARFRSETVNQRGEVVQILTAMIVAPKRPTPSSE